MFELGLGAFLIWLLSISTYVVIPALAIGLGLRLARVRRSKPEDRLRIRLARGEVTRAEFETAIKALGH